MKENRSGIIMIALFLAAVVVYGIWEFNIRTSVSKYGVYTKCYVLEVLGYKGGLRIEVEFHLKGMKYTAVLNSEDPLIKEGDQLLIQALPLDPRKIVVIQRITQKCMLDKEAPENGWVEFPTCNN